MKPLRLGLKRAAKETATRTPDAPTKDDYLKWAARACEQAREATTGAARAIHLDIAREYAAKAAAITVTTRE
ncbi:MAG: hypothetical protein JWR80_770 [Bradyrhizobium sp.]|nr:hypothetical protein [Bradyrhizobium sp.]